MSNANAAGIEQVLNQNPEGGTIGKTAAILAGFHGAAVIQHASTGETTGFAAVGGTNVDSNDTFTGNVGSKAYTLNDVVKALKEKGVLES